MRDASRFMRPTLDPQRSLIKCLNLVLTAPTKEQAERATALAEEAIRGFQITPDAVEDAKEQALVEWKRDQWKRHKESLKVQGTKKNEAFLDEWADGLEI